MRERTYWVDHVLSASSQFTVVATGTTDVYTITPYGTVMQQGTAQDAEHFNSIEEGLVANELATNTLIIHAMQQEQELDELTETMDDNNADFKVQYATVTLTNTLDFPFNNSEVTIALPTTMPNKYYRVDTEVTAFDGNVGEIVVSEKQTNGFKLAYTGSASSVTIKYTAVSIHVDNYSFSYVTTV